MIDWIQSSGARILAVVLAVWLFNRFGRYLVRKAIRRALTADKFATEQDEVRREDTLVGIISTTLSAATWLIAALLIVSEFGFDIGPLVAGAGVIGLALAFGAQEIVKDFISGVFIVIENQYRVGDVVSINGTSGKVIKVSIRTTVLRDLDGNVHHIRNGQIDMTTNKTMEFSRVNMDVGVSYEDDIDKVEKVINEVGAKLFNDKDWQERIIEALRFSRVKSFDDSSVTVKILGKTKPGDHWQVAGEFRRRLKKAFEKAGIEIPFPQRVVHQGKQKKK